MIASPKQAAIFWKVTGIFLICLGLLGAGSLVKKEYRLALFGERSTGVVDKVEKITTSTSSKWVTRNGTQTAIPRGGELTFMHIAFTTKEGKSVGVETVATFHTEAKVGDSHPMIYLPAHPENAKIYSAKQLWLPMIVGTVFSTGCIWLGWWLVKRKFPSLKGPALPVLSNAARSADRQQPGSETVDGALHSAPVVIPGIRELFHRDFTFGRAVKTMIGGPIVMAGIYWATRPIPGVIIEYSPERAAMPYIITAAAIATVIAAVVAVRRHRTLCRTLLTGALVKGRVETTDTYVRRTDDQTDMDRTRTYSRSYVVTVSYLFRGVSYLKRLRTPLSPSTYGAMQGKEVDILLLPESPSRPLIRSVYLGRF